MKFKSIACPSKTPGVKVEGPSLTVPSQSMSLQEILERFTRNESLPVGRTVNYHESEDDISKVQHMDLVDRQEFADKLEKTKKAYEAQEKAKAKKQREKLEAEEREKIRGEISRESSTGGKGAPDKGGPGKAD